MSKLLKITAFICASFLMGCASVDRSEATRTVSTVDGKTLNLKSSVSNGGFKNTRDGKALYVNVKGSKNLTKLLKDDLSAFGYKITDEQSAAVKINVDVAYVFYKPKMKPNGINFAEVIERGAQEDSAAFNESSSTSGLRIEMSGVVNSFLNPTATSFFFKANLVELALQAAGFHDSVNKALTGDSRGICLANCQHWNSYIQQMNIQAIVEENGKSGRSVIRVLTEFVDPKLEPGQMYVATMPEFKRLLLEQAGK